MLTDNRRGILNWLGMVREKRTSRFSGRATISRKAETTPIPGHSLKTETTDTLLKLNEYFTTRLQQGSLEK